MSDKSNGEELQANGRDEMGLTPAQREWLAHIEQCEVEGLTYKAYCKREGLKVGGLYSARKALRAANATSRTSPPRFAAVRLAQPEVAARVEIALVNGVQLSVMLSSVDALLELVRGLDHQPQ